MTQLHRVAILQSNYIPWKGYFDLIDSVDDFVIYDEVQYTRRDWRNRNKIKLPGGPTWLTIPVQVRHQFEQKISATKVSSSHWAREHWLSISHAYARAKYFELYRDVFKELYDQAQSLEYLSQINCLFIEAICRILKIDTKLHQSSGFVFLEGRTERLVGICHDLKASTYVSGPAAKDYLDEQVFSGMGMSVEWFKYGPYASYEQLYPPFEAAVSVLDLLFATGEQARTYIKPLVTDSAV